SITARGTNVTWDIDGRRLATVDTTALTLSTNIFVGYHDPFVSVTTNAAVQFGLFDNVRVESLGRPNITAISYQGTFVLIDFTGEAGDSTTDFEIQKTATLNATFGSVSASITDLGNNQFRANVLTSGGVSFFRVHRF